MGDSVKDFHCLESVCETPPFGSHKCVCLCPNWHHHPVLSLALNLNLQVDIPENEAKQNIIFHL